MNNGKVCPDSGWTFKSGQVHPCQVGWGGLRQKQAVVERGGWVQSIAQAGAPAGRQSSVCFLYPKRMPSLGYRHFLL